LTRKIRNAREQKRTKRNPKRKPATIFQNAMIAATFAQAGEFESAQEIMGTTRKQNIGKKSLRKERT
jgi:hypothetical protein